MIYLASGLGGVVIGLVGVMLLKEWACKKAEEKYDLLDQPKRFIARAVVFVWLPILPFSLAWGLFCGFVF